MLSLRLITLMERLKKERRSPMRNILLVSLAHCFDSPISQGFHGWVLFFFFFFFFVSSSLISMYLMSLNKEFEGVASSSVDDILAVPDEDIHAEEEP
ncbi:hypothetical protein ACLB2K_048620 [Fragaria x ananassa]